MQRVEYGVGRYVAVEQLIFDTKDDYYATLSASTTGWFDDGTHSVWPWAGYFLDRIAQAYERFADRVAAGTSAGTKQNRIRDYVLLHLPPSSRSPTSVVQCPACRTTRSGWCSPN